MQKKIVWDWEILDANTRRVKVIGGWLIESNWAANKSQISVSTVFVADRDHEWHVIPPHKEEKPPENKLAADFGSPESKF